MNVVICSCEGYFIIYVVVVVSLSKCIKLFFWFWVEVICGYFLLRLNVFDIVSEVEKCL